jgi:hypothetical protein
MKTIKQIITVVAVAMFMLSSFTGNAQVNNPYNNYGIEHNKILDFAYNKIKNSEVTVLKKTVKREFFSNIILDYYSTNKIKTNLTKANLNEFFSEFVFPPKLSPTYPDYNKLPYSNQYINFTNLIFDKTVKGDIASMLNLVNDINKYEGLTKKEKENLLKITSLAYNSLNYWRNNSGKWLTLAPNNKSQSKKAPPLGRIAGADVGGAIAGTIFPGVGTVAGGAGASIVQGCVEFVDWLF